MWACLRRSFHTMPGKQHSQPTLTSLGQGCVFSCNLLPALLTEWPSSFMCHCCNKGVERWDSNWQPFNHESSTLTNKLSWLRIVKAKSTQSALFQKLCLSTVHKSWVILIFFPSTCLSQTVSHRLTLCGIADREDGAANDIDRRGTWWEWLRLGPVPSAGSSRLDRLLKPHIYCITKYFKLNSVTTSLNGHTVTALAHTALILSCTENPAVHYVLPWILNSNNVPLPQSLFSNHCLHIHHHISTCWY